MESRNLGFISFMANLLIVEGPFTKEENIEWEGFQGQIKWILEMSGSPVGHQSENT